MELPGSPPGGALMQKKKRCPFCKLSFTFTLSDDGQLRLALHEGCRGSGAKVSQG